MKKLIAIITGIFLSLIGLSQSCLPGGITFHNQNEIDSFQVNYPGCTVIEGDVYIGDFGGGSNIHDLSGLSTLEAVGGSLSVRYCDSLTSLVGLQNIISVGNALSIHGNPALTSLEGLEGVTESYYLNVSTNDGLTSLTGLGNLASIGYGLYIDNNPSLFNLTGLEGLTSVGAGFNINSNNALVSLDGLDNLATIGNGMAIEYNNALENIEALQNLTSIHSDDHPGNLSIKANLALTSLTGLDNIEPESIVDLSIGWNLALSTCDVNSICQYLAAPNGYVAIRYNAPGCNSQPEVEAACGVGIDESAVGGRRSAVKIFPNPSCGIVECQLSIVDCQKVSLKIYDIQGREMMVTFDEQLPVGKHFFWFDISDLPGGVYFLRLEGERTVDVVKFIKID